MNENCSWRFLKDHQRDLKSSDKRNLTKKKSFIFSSNFSEIELEKSDNMSRNLNERKGDLKFQRTENETKLKNEITIYDDRKDQKKIEKMINRWFDLWKNKYFTMKISKSFHMSITFKPNWTDKIKFNKIYSLRFKKQIFINEIFDKFHDDEKMKWVTQFTPFGYSVFVIWKTIVKNEKSFREKKTVVNIRKLNDITIIDAYFMFSQADITAAMTKCSHIFIVDAQSYFFQWLMKKKNKYKQTIIFHRGQKQFNVIVMRFKNSPAYVQKQIDNMLKRMRSFARIFIDDIMFFSRNLENHLDHLNQNFEKLSVYEIILSFNKSFLKYSSVIFLSQKIDAFELTTIEKKLKTIAKFVFSNILKELKTYLELTKWLRTYVLYYVQMAKSLQKRKILLLKKKFTKENPRKQYVKKTYLKNSTNNEIKTYNHFQTIFSKFNFFIHFSIRRFFFIDVNVSKQWKFENMMFHVRENLQNITFNKKNIQFILFLSKQLFSAEKKYWSIELKIADVVWIAKKIRHLIKSSKKSFTMIFTDHSATIDLMNQIFLITSNIDKLNLRFVRTSQYFFTLFIVIKVKFEKFHIISDVLFRLTTISKKKSRSQIQPY